MEMKANNMKTKANIKEAYLKAIVSQVSVAHKADIMVFVLPVFLCQSPPGTWNRLEIKKLQRKAI